MKVKLLMMIAAVVMISACEKAPESSTRAGGDFVVDKLFKVDGCTVYRFSDGGRPRYFTNCNGSTQWSESCGKSCTNDTGIDGGLK